MRLAKQQYKLSQSEKYNNSCSLSFEKSIVIPCCHTIKDLLSLSLKVKESHFDTYWLFRRPPAPVQVDSDFNPAPHVLTNRQIDLIRHLLLQQGLVDINNIDLLLRDKPAELAVLPPAVIRTKGRPQKKDYLTRRELSVWERNRGVRSSGVSTTP